MASSSSPPASRWRPGHRSGQPLPRPRVAGRPPVAGPVPGPRPERTEPTGRPATSASRDRNLVLDVQNLRTYFFTYDGVVRALEGVDLQARAGETTGVVGETGCGKSVTAFSVARLVSEPGRVISGKVLLNGVDLLWGLDREAKYRRIGNTGRVRVRRRFRAIRAANERISAVRGRGVAMIFQEPTQAMNPVFSIADQLGEAVMLHRGLEVLDGLLGAGRGGAATGHLTGGEFAAEPTPLEAGALGAPREEIDALIKAAADGRSEVVRSAARAVATTMGLPSLETELFYLARGGDRTSPRLRRQLYKAVGRVHLTKFQRNYVRHLRRLEVLREKLKEIYIKEMRLGRSFRGARSRLQLQIRVERLRHFYFGIFGLGRRARRPVKNELFWRAVRLLEGVNIANPSQVARGFPHELSGGMLQRAMIAMALSCEPGLLLADEPTTALDVTIQAQILDLMRQLRERVGTAIVLITHDLGVVAEVCDRVNVMYAGIVVETGTVGEVFRRPLHPYTNGLLSSIPRFDQPDRELYSIPGTVPNLTHPPPGCRFHPRCPYAMPICREVRPKSLPYEGNHFVACHLYTEVDNAPPEPTATAAPAEEPQPAPLVLTETPHPA